MDERTLGIYGIFVLPVFRIDMNDSAKWQAFGIYSLEAFQLSKASKIPLRLTGRNKRFQNVWSSPTRPPIADSKCGSMAAVGCQRQPQWARLLREFNTKNTHTHWFCLKGKKFGWEVREVLKGHHIDQNEEDEWNGRPMNGEEVGEAAFLVNAFGSSSCGRWSATRAMSLFEGNRKAGNEIDKAG